MNAVFVYGVAVSAVLAAIVVTGLAVARDDRLGVLDALGLLTTVVGVILGAFWIAVELWGRSTTGRFIGVAAAVAAALAAVLLTLWLTRRRDVDRRLITSGQSEDSGWRRTDMRHNRDQDNDT